jgi:hypothetical protein
LLTKDVAFEAAKISAALAFDTLLGPISLLLL